MTFSLEEASILNRGYNIFSHFNKFLICIFHILALRLGGEELTFYNKGSHHLFRDKTGPDMKPST